jgi:hypothetical protein
MYFADLTLFIAHYNLVKFVDYDEEITFLIFCGIFTLNSSAQSYRNEWIDYSKTYYKFKVFLV